MTAPKRRLSMFIACTAAALLPAGGAAADATHYTALPELQDATVVATTSADAASASTPAGTTIDFRFDEPVDTAALVPDSFAVYDRHGDETAAKTVTVKGDTVTALFPVVDTQEALHRLTLAVAKAGAVQDEAGGANPIGAVPVTRWRSRKASGPQGCLRMRDGHRLRRVDGNTTVQVTFSSCGDGDTTFEPHGFRLQMVDGRSIRSLRVRPRAGDPARATVVFPGKHYAPGIARLTVDRDAVDYEYIDCCEYEEYASNALQALTISHRGNTVRPDLVRVKLLPNGRAGRPDHALYHFDQPVTRPVAKRFLLSGADPARRAVVRAGHPREVYVTFAPTAAASSTFAAVQAGAVHGSRADEVATPNVLWSEHVTTGLTLLPDLYNVRYFNHDSVGTSVLTAHFEFDTALADAVDAEAFALFGKSGVRYVADRCTVTNRTDLPEKLATVICTFPDAPASRSDDYTATVDPGAVHDEAGLGNPEGSGFALWD